MRQFSVLGLLLFESFVVLLVLFSDALNLVVLLGQYVKTILLQIFYFLLESSSNVLRVGLGQLSFSIKFFKFTVFLLYPLGSKLFFFFDEINPLIILITHSLILDAPLCVQGLKLIVFVGLFRLEFQLKIIDFTW